MTGRNEVLERYEASEGATFNGQRWEGVGTENEREEKEMIKVRE